jgi:hypothetical protein
VALTVFTGKAVKIIEKGRGDSPFCFSTLGDNCFHFTIEKRKGSPYQTAFCFLNQS